MHNSTLYADSVAGNIPIMPKDLFLCNAPLKKWGVLCNGIKHKFSFPPPKKNKGG